MRTPTVSTPQCTNTAAPAAAAARTPSRRPDRPAGSGASPETAQRRAECPSSSSGTSARTRASPGRRVEHEEADEPCGWRDHGGATEASSPGMLAMRAARATVWRSSSATQRSASSSGVPGGSHPSFAETAAARSPEQRPFPGSAARETGWRRNDSACRRASSSENCSFNGSGAPHRSGVRYARQFRDEVRGAAGVSLILHAGDVGGARVLRGAARHRAGQGRCSETSTIQRPALEPRLELTVGGLTVHVSHGHELGVPTPKGCCAPIRPTSWCSATRTALGSSESDHRLVVNPGAAGPRRFNLRPSVARLSIADGIAAAEIIWLS